MAFIVAGPAICSGTVVSPNVVLTAGHCVVDETTGAILDPSNVTVSTGAVDLTDLGHRQVSGVSQVLVAPGFNSATLAYDAALLVLSTPTTAPSIRVATSADQALEQAGTGAFIAGWGLTSADSSSSAILQWAGTVVQSSAYCGQFHWQPPVGYLGPELQVCTINSPSKNTATCQGDSGGPLLPYSADGKPIAEIGITSWGGKGCPTTLPNYFTLVRPLSTWIRGEITRVAPIPPPAVTTAPAGQVTTSSASVTGTVNPNGDATAYRFDYGTSSSYGSQTASQDAGSGSSALSVSASLTGLAPGTTYHYRVEATNNAGTSYGDDGTFTTSSPPTRVTVTGWRVVVRKGPKRPGYNVRPGGTYRRCRGSKVVEMWVLFRVRGPSNVRVRQSLSLNGRPRISFNANSLRRGSKFWTNAGFPDGWWSFKAVQSGRTIASSRLRLQSKKC